MADVRSYPPRWPVPLSVLAAAVTVFLVVALLTGAGTLALAWLVGWLFCLSITVGASVWLLIGSLTGGRWRHAAAPVLEPLSRSTWIVAVLGVPLISAAPLLYPWWAGATGAGQALWLDPALFGLRALPILGLWSALGILAGRKTAPALASLGLILHGVAVSVASLDWLLSLDPSFVSTTFGAHLAIFQLGMAMAVVGFAGTGGRAGDIGGLMLACVLGVFYLGAMEYLVSWSGNLPDKAHWYLARQQGAGAALLWLSFGLGVLGPFLVLLSSRARRSAATLRWVGASIFAGGALHLVWLAAPGHFAGVALMTLALIAAAVALIMITGGRHER